MSDTPPPDVIASIENGTTHVIRRLEFFESDGETTWKPEGLDLKNQSRLVEGSVSIDYNRDERRTIDLTLLNNDKLLRPNPHGGLWYDKVMKVFRGVRYASDPRPPRVAVIYAPDDSFAYNFAQILKSIGFTRTDVVLDWTTYEDVSSYDILVFYGRDEAAGLDVLEEAYAAGKKIFTTGNQTDVGDIPLVTAAADRVSNQEGIMPTLADHVLFNSFSGTDTYTLAGGKKITGIAATATEVARFNDGASYYTAAVIDENDVGGRWFHFQPALIYPESTKLFRAALTWLHNYAPYKTWETQVGEYVIDNISEAHFPYQVKVTGRDYTKRCLTSKIERASSFVAGTSLRDLIQALAANAGIRKFRLPPTDEVLPGRIDIERGTERWAVMKQAAEANGYEIFFDNQGYLTMRKFQDPSFSAVTTNFQTGLQGNLASLERSVNDSRIYNHIVIYGDPAEGEAERLPYFGEAINDDPASPTNRDRIGDRLFTFASSFFTEESQCQELAEAYLKLHALESYELNFSSLNYPWLEAGDIALVLDPDRLAIDPTRFLMDTITIPLGLGPMSVTAKRVTFVGAGDASVAPMQIETV